MAPPIGYGPSPYGPPPQPSYPAKKGAPVGLIAVFILGAGALLGVLVWTLNRPKDPGPKVATVNTTDSTTSKPKTKSTDDKPKDPWQTKVETLNPFHVIGAKKFSLQQHEATREEFTHYVLNASSPIKPLQDFSSLVAGNKEKLPVTWVTYEAAEDFCKELGGRVPTAEEWDSAVHGPNGQKYPWGNEWPKKDSPDFRDLAAGKKGMGIIDVETSSYDKGPYGNFDLAGNVQEWTSTTAKSGTHKLLRGTDVNDDETVFADPSELFFGDPSAADPAKAGAEVGFRCAKDSK